MTQKDFEEIGRQAYEAGEPAAPILNADVHVAVASLPVGGDARKIFEDFSRGWHAANLADNGQA